VLGAEHERDEITAAASRPAPHRFRLCGTAIELRRKLLQRHFSVRYDDNDRFGGKATYRVAPAYLIEETGTKLKASVGTGFKAPTLARCSRIFRPIGFFGNPNLKPESSVGYDVGFEQSVFEERVRSAPLTFATTSRI
jgi:vitamin B12 transporter